MHLLTLLILVPPNPTCCITMATVPMMVAPEMATTMVAGPLPGNLLPSNAHSVNYFDENKQVYTLITVLFSS